MPSFWGLSPRLRGNLIGEHERVGVARSIPACAGEPTLSRRARRRTPVYPRACGGTLPLGIALKAVAGLSPRVRGNPESPASSTRMRRSIPARAGEPYGCDYKGHVGEVYPRACGGTCSKPPMNPSASGLSPRVRGIPTALNAALPFLGLSPRVRGNP